MNAQHKRWLLGLALGATVLAAYLAPPEANSVVVLSTAAERSSATRASPSAAGTASPRLTVREIVPRADWSPEGIDLFDADDELRVSLAPPVEPVPATLAPPVPAEPAPPPLRMIGRYVEDGLSAAFVQFNDQNLVLRPGDRVGDVYEVERVDDASMLVRHLATDQEQTVTLHASP